MAGTPTTPCPRQIRNKPSKYQALLTEADFRQAEEQQPFRKPVMRQAAWAVGVDGLGIKEACAQFSVSAAALVRRLKHLSDAQSA